MCTCVYAYYYGSMKKKPKHGVCQSISVYMKRGFSYFVVNTICIYIIYIEEIERPTALTHTPHTVTYNIYGRHYVALTARTAKPSTRALLSGVADIYIIHEE